MFAHVKTVGFGLIEVRWVFSWDHVLWWSCIRCVHQGRIWTMVAVCSTTQIHDLFQCPLKSMRVFNQNNIEPLFSRLDWDIIRAGTTSAYIFTVPYTMGSWTWKGPWGSTVIWIKPIVIWLQYAARYTFYNTPNWSYQQGILFISSLQVECHENLVLMYHGDGLFFLTIGTYNVSKLSCIESLHFPQRKKI